MKIEDRTKLQEWRNTPTSRQPWEIARDPGTPESYKVEKGVVLQPKPPRFPLDVMEVGDSFLVPTDRPGHNFAAQNRILGAALYHRPKRFVTRSVVGGVRCWRTV